MRAALWEYRFIALVVVLGAVLFVARSQFRSADYYGLTTYAADAHWIGLAERALHKLQLPDGVKWTVNPSPSDDGVAIFVFDSAKMPDQKFQHLTGNCSYLGDKRTIACDVALIDQMTEYYSLDLIEKTRADQDGYIQERWLEKRNVQDIDVDYELLFTWIMAHELGHLLSGHSGKFYFTKHKANVNFDSKNYCHSVEFEADEYAVEILNKTDVEAFYLFVYDLINRELYGLACPGQPKILTCDRVEPGTGMAIIEEDVEYLTDGTHPDYAVRLIRLGLVAQKIQDFGLLAYQLDQLADMQLKTVRPGTRNDPCLME